MAQRLIGDLRRGGVDAATLDAAGFDEPYPRAGIEWLIATAPEVILDASEDPEMAAHYWARWPSLPAVAAGRTVALPADEVTRPGAYLDRALRRLRAALAAAPSP